MSQSSQPELSQSENSPDFPNLAPSHNLPEHKPKEQKKQQENNLVSLIRAPQKQLNLARQNKPRLIIDRIVLQNFKSYAGKLTIGPFHENFTSVVGPNGSGKSNLIESLLFIFGYNASWMRLNRLHQLIHNSSTMSGITKASVEVHFKKILEVENGKFVDIDDSKFSIQRVVNTSSTSKYYLNHRDSTQNEIKTKLKSEGIDLNNNRFLILQGEVEQISQMKQKSGDRDKPGLLQYLEDITGSSAYITKIQENVQEYNKLEELRHEKGEMMKIVETELKGMSKGKEEAIKYVKKQKQTFQIQNILNQVIISNNKFEVGELSKKLERLENEKERIIKEEKEKLKKQGERIKEIKRLKNEIEILQKKIQQLEDQLHKFNIEDENIKQEIIFKSEDSIKYKKKIQTLEQQLTSIINESDDISKNLPKNKDQKRKLENQIEQLKAELSKHDDTKFTTKLKTLENEVKDCEHELNSFQDKLRLAKRNYDKKYLSTQNSQVRIVELEQKIDEEKEYMEKLSQSIELATKKAETLHSDRDHNEKERKLLKNELSKIQMVLREQINENKERGMVNNMFQKIMEEKIPGVIGRLGDLGSVIDKKYDEIITSCSGGRLDNIVVSNYEAAKAVTDFLKKTKLGRITCIILDIVRKQVGGFMEKRWEDLPDSKRLFDVIEPVNEEAKLAFYFAISDTIYCENSNLGMKYAMGDERNRRRVVSRKSSGYIIYERNGMMLGCPAKKGGFDVKAKTKMRNQNNSRELKEMQAEKKKITTSLNQILMKLDELMKGIKEVESDVYEMKKQKQKILSNITSCEEEISDIKKSSLQQTKNYELEKSTKEKQINAIEDHLQKLTEKCKSRQKMISDIEEERKKLETTEISRKREDYKLKKQQYLKLQKEIQKSQAVLGNTKKRITENQTTKDKYQKTMEKLEKDLQKLKKERQKIQVEATKIAGESIALNQNVDQHKKNEQELKVLYEDDDKVVKESKKKIDQAKAEVETCRQQIRRYENGIGNAKAQLKKVRETYRQLISTYDFLEELEEIEGMKVEGFRSGEQKSMMESSIFLNQSVSMDKSMSTKIFPLEQLLVTSPFDDFDEEQIDPFLLFHDKLVSFLVSETEALKKLTGSNLLIINEYKTKYTEFKTRQNEFQGIIDRQRELKILIEELKNSRLTTFKEGFCIINSKLKQVYQLLTRGGDAQLELIDSLDPFSQGINFSVRPPKKTWKEINKLSGGQKTLSSLSLIFALHYYKPTPLYFMDEIDAALDFKNVSVVSDYIKQRTKDAQFIIISLRNNMFELADKLVGVYKTYDKTKVVQFIPEKFKEEFGKKRENLDKKLIS